MLPDGNGDGRDHGPRKDNDEDPDTMDVDDAESGGVAGPSFKPGGKKNRPRKRKSNAQITSEDEDEDEHGQPVGAAGTDGKLPEAVCAPLPIFVVADLNCHWLQGSSSTCDVY